MDVFQKGDFFSELLRLNETPRGLTKGNNNNWKVEALKSSFRGANSISILKRAMVKRLNSEMQPVLKVLMK